MSKNKSFAGKLHGKIKRTLKKCSIKILPEICVSDAEAERYLVWY